MAALQHLMHCAPARLLQLVGVALCAACAADTTDRSFSGSIVNTWTERPPPSETIIPGLDEVALFDRVSARLEQSFVLPEDLGVLHLACGTENAFYDPQAKRIRMCDELLNKVVSVTRNGLASSDAEAVAQVHSTWVLMFLHEVGHAFIDIFDLIVLGNEEDAVDDFAALLLVNAGEANMAQLALGYWAVRDRASATPKADEFADEHGLNLQRYYSGLCLVYGSDPAAHQDIVQQGLLPADRAVRCEEEYKRVLSNWKAALGTRLRDIPNR